MDRDVRSESADVLDEVRKAEEEIDRFLRENSEQAEKILLGGREEAKEINRRGAADNLEAGRLLRDRLLKEAETQAAQIESEGEAAAKTEAERLEKLREGVVAQILRLVRAERL